MLFPKLNEQKRTRETVDIFSGYNHNLRIGSGEFYEMKNLTSDHYPVLSPRRKRGIFATPTIPQGMIAKDSLCYIDGGDIIINGERVTMGLTADATPKTLISMGAYIVILPDKKYVNATDTTDKGAIEASMTTIAETTFTLTKMDGDAYGDVVVQAEAPSNPENLSLWIDTSSSPHQLKQYSTTTEAWTTINTTYVKISSTGIGLPFEVNDGVTISGVEALPDLNASSIIWSKGDNYIVVTGIIDEVVTQTAAITVERAMPNMDFVIESENRLWGCRYGEAKNGEMVNEIYASKLGDFKNWNSFMGISTDSYAVTVGTDGAFTGAITHLGYPLFFKENCLHKIYGNYPANYQVQTTFCRGVQKGCERSLALVNEKLFYKSRTGVCAFDGSLPVEISEAFGEEEYFNAAGGSLGNKYYISMQDLRDGWHMFAYDSRKGMWHREDDTQVTQFCACKGELYFIDYADNQIKTVRGTGDEETVQTRWEAVTGIIGTDSPEKKYVSRLDVRMSLPVGARITFFVEYDSSGAWEHLFTMTGKDMQTFSVPCRARRSDHLRLRIVGTGEGRIFSITKTVEQGGGA